MTTGIKKGHRKGPKTAEGRKRVSDKIRVLMREDGSIPQRQAVAEALSMERAGRLRKGGGYVRASKGHGRGRKRKLSRSRRHRG